MSDKSKLVYICSPYRTGDVDENVRRAREYCRLAVEEGFIPVAPHLLYPQFLSDEDETQRQAGIECGLELLSVCAEVWVFDYNYESRGMNCEIAFAKDIGVPVKFMTTEVIYHLDGHQSLRLVFPSMFAIGADVDCCE